MSQEKQRTTRCIDVKGLMKKKMHRLGGVANMLENSILDPNIGKKKLPKHKVSCYRGNWLCSDFQSLFCLGAPESPYTHKVLKTQSELLPWQLAM